MLYRKIDLRGVEIDEPWTPLVWSAFLTGKLPDKIGINKLALQKWSNPILQFLLFSQ